MTFYGTKKEWESLDNNVKQQYSEVVITPILSQSNAISHSDMDGHCGIDSDVDDTNHLIGGFHD